MTHDMPWSPDSRWTPFVLGLDTPAPRAVPSDAAAVLLGKVVGASLAQHLILVLILAGLALGAVALLGEILPEAGIAARCVAAVSAVWNPFVSERLAVGQWTVLLGLAVLPWALRAAVRVVAARTGGYAVALALVCSAVGGINPLLMVSSSVVLALLTGLALKRTAQTLRVFALTLLVSAGSSAAWALPALMTPPAPSGAGVREFAPAADSPVGVVGSLLGGGGFWNVGTHPEPRSHVLIAATAALLAVASVATALVKSPGRSRWILGVPVLVLAGLVMVSAVEVLEPLWHGLVTSLPGGGALRDSQKLMAGWVVLAATGVGVLAHELRRRVHVGLVAPVLALLLALPVVLSPQLAWGLGGRLEAVTVPASYRSGLDALAALPRGEAGLLPWNQYRRYGWNGDRVSLTLVPRMVDRVVVYDDSLPLRSGRVPGESPRAAEVSRRIAEGAGPDEALAGADVRYLIAELDAGFEVDTTALRGMGRVVVDQESLLVVDLGTDDETANWPVALVAGWWVTLLTTLGVLAWRGVPTLLRKLPVGLLTSHS